MKQILQHEMKLNTIYVLELSSFLYIIYLKERQPNSLKMKLVYLMDNKLFLHLFKEVIDKKLCNILSLDTLQNAKCYKINNVLSTYPLTLEKNNETNSSR